MGRGVMPDDPLAVTWGGHSTALIELDGVRILTDPVLRDRVGPLRRISASVSPMLGERIDAVVLSHLHHDHTDVPSLLELDESTVVLAPHGAARWLARQGVPRVEELRKGESADVGGVRVVATPAHHAERRHPLGVRADALGFMLQGSQVVYFAGDTDLFDEMREFAHTVDVALLPIGGWGPRLGPGHLDPARAAEAAARIAPRIAVPIHWGTLALGWPARPPADPRAPARQFAALMARDVRDVEVRVLAPGERTGVSRRARAVPCTQASGA